MRFALVAESSRHEHLAPWLETEDGDRATLYALGDNPFENERFCALEGQRVRVTGEWRNGTLRVRPEDIVRLTEGTT